MGTVSAKLEVPYPASVPEALWYDPSRWASFIDGFGHLGPVDARWPAVGTTAIWESHPGGRGRVTETVQAYEPRVGSTTAVEDATLTGTQTIAFTPREDGCTVKLTLAYDIKQRTAFTPIVDALFVRRAQIQALQRTLRRFAYEVRGDQDLAG